jgi:hypothetical protein
MTGSPLTAGADIFGSDFGADYSIVFSENFSRKNKLVCRAEALTAKAVSMFRECDIVHITPKSSLPKRDSSVKQNSSKNNFYQSVTCVDKMLPPFKIRHVLI